MARNVKVRASLDSAGAIDFDIDGVKAKHSRIKLAKDSGPDELHFHLLDQSGKELRFDAADPIWVDEDGPCPPTSGISSDQLDVKACQPDKLSIANQNDGRARELRYQLNFIAADGSAATCDPIIENGGGGGNIR